MDTRSVSWTSTLALAAALALLSGACARQSAIAPLALGPISADDSAICEGLADRFIGLPGQASTGAAAPPMVGRWWIRSCTARPVAGELRIRLAGPGWYWIDESHNGLVVRQQVPFDLSLELDTIVRMHTVDGVVSVWLEPAREARVELEPAEKLTVRGHGAWGLVLGAVLPVRTMATKRFADEAAKALRDGLQNGATLTYEIQSGQADAALSKLEDGQKPSHPFRDRSSWLVNERLLLPPGATHVVGPLPPGQRGLDVTVESGTGLAYRAVCQQAMPEEYPAIAGGRVGAISARALAANANVAGLGPHETSLDVQGCSYYLVLSTLARKPTVAALRVRG